MTEFLTHCKIEMLVHPIANFSSSSDLDTHKENRKLTEKIENELINYLIEQFGFERILNKKFTKIKVAIFDKLTSEIINHLETQKK